MGRQKNYRPVQIDKLISRIAEKLDFAFEVVVAPRGMYGKKESSSGEWDGLIGDIARGETDLVVADLTMTSEREEVIDFVSPYFDQDRFSFDSPDSDLFILRILCFEVLRLDFRKITPAKDTELKSKSRDPQNCY